MRTSTETAAPKNQLDWCAEPPALTNPRVVSAAMGKDGTVVLTLAAVPNFIDLSLMTDELYRQLHAQCLIALTRGDLDDAIARLKDAYYHMVADNA